MYANSFDQLNRAAYVIIHIVFYNEYLRDDGYFPPLMTQMALDSNSKLARVREAMSRADWPVAIRLAAKFHTLGKHKEAIRRANDALNSPDTYTELGYDLTVVMQAGIDALKDRFSRSWEAVEADATDARRQTEVQDSG
jgi:hypothetical protein